MGEYSSANLAVAKDAAEKVREALDGPGAAHYLDEREEATADDGSVVFVYDEENRPYSFGQHLLDVLEKSGVDPKDYMLQVLGEEGTWYSGRFVNNASGIRPSYEVDTCGNPFIELRGFLANNYDAETVGKWLREAAAQEDAPKSGPKAPGCGK